MESLYGWGYLSCEILRIPHPVFVMLSKYLWRCKGLRLSQNFVSFLQVFIMLRTTLRTKRFLSSSPLRDDLHETLHEIREHLRNIPAHSQLVHQMIATNRSVERLATELRQSNKELAIELRQSNKKLRKSIDKVGVDLRQSNKELRDSIAELGVELRQSSKELRAELQQSSKELRAELRFNSQTEI